MQKKLPKAQMTLRAVTVTEGYSESAKDYDSYPNPLIAIEQAQVRALCSAAAPGGVLVLSVWHPFMILKGVATHYEDRSAGVEYVMPSFAHLPSAYFTHLQRLGFVIDVLEEPVVDNALVERLPHMAKHNAFPLALILRATRC